MHQYKLTFLLLLFCNALCACLPDGIILDSQLRIDQFAMQYAGCSSIEGDLIVRGNDITNLDGLSNLTSIVGDLKVWESPNLASIAGLSNLTNVGGTLHLINDPKLLNLTGLDQLNVIGGSLIITYNFRLGQIEALQSLTSIGGELFIANNDNLLSLQGLEGITSVPEILAIADNNQLSNLQGLNNLSTIGDQFRISGQELLTSLSGLEKLTAVGGELRIENTSLLTDFTGLEGLTNIDGNLWLFNNEVLENVSALSSLQKINGTCYIVGNPKLNSLDGLSGIDPMDISRLFLQNCPELSFCSVTSICTYLENGGDYQISGNKIGCNSLMEIQEACVATAATTIASTPRPWRVFPNPSKGVFQILGTGNTTKITVYNQLGQTIYREENPVDLDLSEAPTGWYWLLLEGEGQRQLERLLKQ